MVSPGLKLGDFQRSLNMMTFYCKEFKMYSEDVLQVLVTYYIGKQLKGTSRILLQIEQETRKQTDFYMTSFKPYLNKKYVM